MSLLGEILLDLLEQDQVWRTADRRIIPLQQMEASHRVAVLPMLVQMAPDLYADWLTEDPVRARPNPDGCDPHAPGWSPRALELARRWLEQQPLVIRLRQVHTSAWMGTAG